MRFVPRNNILHSLTGILQLIRHATTFIGAILRFGCSRNEFTVAVLADPLDIDVTTHGVWVFSVSVTNLKFPYPTTHHNIL